MWRGGHFAFRTRSRTPQPTLSPYTTLFRSLLQARQLGVDDRNRTDGQQTQPAEGHREIGSGVQRSDEGRESVPGPAQSRVERIDDVCAVEGQCGAVEEDEDL